MTYIFKNKKIKRFINLIDSLEETLFNSKLWIYTPTGLGEIGQGIYFLSKIVLMVIKKLISQD